MSHDKSPTHTPASTDQPATRTTSVFRTIWSSRPVIGSGPKLWRSCDLRRSWHLLSWAANTCLSNQSLVPVIAFRCHFFVSHSAYPSFWELLASQDVRYSREYKLHPQAMVRFLSVHAITERPIWMVRSSFIREWTNAADVWIHGQVP